MKRSLYERVGGQDVIKDVVERLYFKILMDPVLSAFFSYDKMEAIKRHQTDLFVMASGGPSAFKGDLRRAHAPLLEQGLSDIHFDAVKNHLGEVLKEQGHAGDIISEMLDVVEATRDDVLGR